MRSPVLACFHKFDWLKNPSNKRTSNIICCHESSTARSALNHRLLPFKVGNTYRHDDSTATTWRPGAFIFHLACGRHLTCFSESKSPTLSHSSRTARAQDPAGWQLCSKSGIIRTGTFNLWCLSIWLPLPWLWRLRYVTRSTTKIPTLFLPPGLVSGEAR